MSVKKILREFTFQKNLQEGFDPEGSPDLKYYAFDWDDNIVTMPTQIIVLSYDDEEVGISTEDFAEFRTMIGNEPFEYKGKTIVGYAPDPYRNFKVTGDDQFIVDSMIATPGPSWNDFVECINGGSIFSIITARGHTPSVMRDAVYNYIVSDHNGIDKEELITNLKKYRELAAEDIGDNQTLINQYLDLCKFYPVTFGEGSASNPEEGKIKALREFINYVKEMSLKLGKKAFFKNDVKNYFVPQIGFSDDDIRNVEVMKKEFEDEPALKTYSTAGGIKTRY